MKPLARILEAVGKKFNKWTVLAYGGERSAGRYRLAWCACDCGTIRKVDWGTVETGMSRNCGCARSMAKPKHRASKTPEYQAYVDMMRRASDRYKCSNPEIVANYKGRGIGVCPEWDGNPKQFLADMGPRPSPEHSLERIDNERGYSPDNCRWALRHEQGRNQRTNRLLEHNGETRCVAEWAQIVGINVQSIHSRLLRGWAVDRALSEPLKWGRGRPSLTP